MSPGSYDQSKYTNSAMDGMNARVFVQLARDLSQFTFRPPLHNLEAFLCR
jgi:hypothetical protein